MISVVAGPDRGIIANLDSVQSGPAAYAANKQEGAFRSQATYCRTKASGPKSDSPTLRPTTVLERAAFKATLVRTYAPRYSRNHITRLPATALWPPPICQHQHLPQHRRALPWLVRACQCCRRWDARAYDRGYDEIAASGTQYTLSWKNSAEATVAIEFPEARHTPMHVRK